MDEMTAQTLAKNIWELERELAAGAVSTPARLALIRAYSQDIAYREESLEIPPEHRAFLKVREDTRDGVLLLHGSTGSPADLTPLAEELYAGGFSVYVPRLPGHGLGDDSRLDTMPWQGAVTDAENRYRMLGTWCRHLYVIGYSFGGAIALHLDLQPRPRALVLLAPAVFPRLSLFQRMLFALGLDRFLKLRQRLGWRGEVLQAMESARKQRWWRETPLLVSMALDDERVDRQGASWLKARARHERSELLMFDTGGHGFLKGQARDKLFASILEFIKRN